MHKLAMQAALLLQITLAVHIGIKSHLSSRIITIVSLQLLQISARQKASGFKLLLKCNILYDTAQKHTCLAGRWLILLIGAHGCLKSVGHTLVFQLLLHSACTASRLEH